MWPFKSESTCHCLSVEGKLIDLEYSISRKLAALEEKAKYNIYYAPNSHGKFLKGQISMQEALDGVFKHLKLVAGFEESKNASLTLRDKTIYD